MIRKDESAASTELSYIFTFLLGVALLSTFTLWTYNIETATRERWNENALEANLDDIAEAIERADQYARTFDNGTYSEKVPWRFTEADESMLTLSLTDTKLLLIDGVGTLDNEVELSGMGTGHLESQFSISGYTHVWVIHENGLTRIDVAPL